MLDDIEIFVKVVEAGSFTEAAERLNLSKSVVSKYVSRLEDRINVRLLNRTTRRLSLTEAGQVFYERSRYGLQEIQEATEQVATLNSNPSGLLRLNLPMSFGIERVAPLLPDFLSQYPEIELDITLDDRKVEVIEPGFDLSLRISDLHDSSLVAKRIGTCQHAIVAAPEYLSVNGTPDSPEALATHNIVAYRHQDSPLDWRFSKEGEESIFVSVRGNVTANNSLALRELVKGGVGIARMPMFLVANDLQTGALVQVLEHYELLALGVYAVFPQRRYLAAKVRVLIEFLESVSERLC